MTGILAILVSLLLLIWLAYRGFSVLVLAPLMALLAVLLSPGAPLLASYTQVFMPALGGFIVLYFPLFLLGAVFGRLMEVSGAAQAIAQGFAAWLGRERALLAIVLACAVLTYGGVSLFVVAFAVWPIAAALFRAADIPRRLIPATIALGAFTFTMTALPGTPAIQNAIPMPFFNTTPFAAPGLGLIGGAVMAVFGTWWLMRRAASAARAGEGYGGPAPAGPGPAATHGLAPAGAEADAVPQAAGGPLPQAGHAGATQAGVAPPGLPPLALALLPIVLVIALNYLFSARLLPALDTGYLAAAPYGPARLEQVLGVWSIIAALAVSIVVLVALNRHRIADLKGAIDEGAGAAVMPIFNTASQVGFGAVIASLAAFALVRDAVLGIAPGNPLISLSVAVNILAGITGSASGGMSIALQTLGANYLAMAQQAGISPELLHRVTAIATGGLDSLPHNGAVITLLSICGLTHRESYADILVVAVLIPIAALAVVVTLGSALGSF